MSLREKLNGIDISNPEQPKNFLSSLLETIDEQEFILHIWKIAMTNFTGVKKTNNMESYSSKNCLITKGMSTSSFSTPIDVVIHMVNNT